MHTFFRENLFLVEDENLLPVEPILESLRKSTFACIRGVVSEREVQCSLNALKNRFNPALDRPSVGEKPSEVKSNFQKLSVGGTMSMHYKGPYRPRLLRTFYNPLWEEDIYKMHRVFKKMIAVRNQLMERPSEFAMDKVENGLWSAARIHQYPTGGGFMGSHKDNTLSGVASKAGLNYFQLLLIMSKKGKDFDKGGGFIEVKGQRLIFEELCNLGDIVIYDSSTVHGVADVDPQKVLDLENINGRIAAFVSLYKDMGSIN